MRPHSHHPSTPHQTHTHHPSQQCTPLPHTKPRDPGESTRSGQNGTTPTREAARQSMHQSTHAKQNVPTLRGCDPLVGTNPHTKSRTKRPQHVPRGHLILQTQQCAHIPTTQAHPTRPTRTTLHNSAHRSHTRSRAAIHARSHTRKAERSHTSGL